MTLHELAADTAQRQAQREAQAFERTMSRIVPKPDILRIAAETIQRLGAAAQDCKSCARLPLCNAYKDGDGFKNCGYVWTYAEAVRSVPQCTTRPTNRIKLHLESEEEFIRGVRKGEEK